MLRAMLRLEHVTKRYGDFTAVSDLSLHIPPGQIYGFLGPNGAGKTTTMKMIVGLIRPTMGRIVVHSNDISADPLEAKRHVGYVPDRPHLYERLTAVEYMAFVAGLFSMRGASTIRRSHTLLALFGLGDRADQLVESFSHGMKQRLAMASVLLHHPKLFVVDEPMVGLDPRGARLLKDVLRREAREQGLTVMLSTHTLSVAEEVCDMVGILHRGRLIAQASPEALLNHEGLHGERLEEVFLQLTDESQDIADGPKKNEGPEPA